MTIKPSKTQRLPDAELGSLRREDVLQMDAPNRMRWFYLRRFKHAELERVAQDLKELLGEDNETKVISVIGMTGIGKTTLAQSIVESLRAAARADEAHASEVPVIYVRAPADGDRALSWKGLYTRLLKAGNEPFVEMKRATKEVGGVLQLSRERSTLADLRSYLEKMLTHRNVKALVIDEALHLLRFGEYEAIMDTLKSLADIHSTKLFLIGSFDIAELMTQYGQVARRSEIVHYRRYETGKVNPNSLTAHQKEFEAVVAKFQAAWPCREVPNLEAIWHPLMHQSLGSVGLLKVLLLRLASLQMEAKDERFLPAHLKKAFKAKKALAKIEEETTQGEEKLMGACYGDGADLSQEELAGVMPLRKAA